MGVKLGQKWAVKDGNLLASNQVGSRFFNKEFDFSRASNGTYVDRDGLLKTAELYNLIPYSEDFSQWVNLNTTKELVEENNPYLSNTTYSLSANNGSSFKLLYQPVSLSAQDYTISVYVKQKGIGYFQITGVGGSLNNEEANFDLETQTIGGRTASNSTITNVGNDWYRCTMTFTADGSESRVYLGIVDDITDFRVSSFDPSGQDYSFYIFGAQLVEGTQRDYQYTNGLQGLPRVDFSDGVGALLLEPQRSNLLLQSNSFDTTWANTYTSEASGYSGIYNSNNAWLLTKTFSGFSHIFQNVSTSGTKTTSVYAKANTLGGLRLLNIGGGNADAYFDLINGTVTFQDPSTIEATIESVGNGWYRCSFTDAETITQTRIYPVQQDRSFDGTGSIYIQHAQLESGSYPTSIIETTTSQVTRTADVANNCGSAQDFNSEEGVLYAEIAALVDDGTNRRFSLNDGTTTNQVVIGYHSVLNEFRCFVVTASGLSCDLRPSVTSILDYHKIAFKYKENDFSIWVDGVEAATDSSGVVPIGLNQINFTEGNGPNPFYGKVRSVKYFPTALTDEELESLTQG